MIGWLSCYPIITKTEMYLYSPEEESSPYLFREWPAAPYGDYLVR